MSDKAWRILQVIAYLIIISAVGVMFYVTESVGDGVRRMVDRPWWFNWFVGLTVLSVITVTLVEVRRRNGGEISGKVIGQTFFWIAITVAGLMFIWYLRGDFS